MPLKDKTVLITGANGGLGTAVTKAFLEAGASVYGVSRSIHSDAFDYPNFHAHASELRSAEDVRAVFEAVPPLDAVVHLVGGWAGGSRFEDTPDSKFEEMFEANVQTAVHVFRAAIPGMREQGSGRILAVGSRSAIHPAANSAAYNVAKAALVALIRSIAVENADRGITANVVLPGTIDTPANRKAMPNADRSAWVPPASIAALLVTLASASGAAVSGAAIPIYGEPA